ncbi:MAG: hypothetical protein HZB14_08455 [Actinobacteria bacterium]|nr:hypothetical protein [Actinomycetota bacterium]
MAAIVVTPDRLIVQDLTRKFEPKGEAVSMTPATIADVRAGGGGGGWYNASSMIMDELAVELKLRTTDGQKLKLLMMRSEGGLIGKLGGGETQRLGVQAIGEWFASHADATSTA